MQKRIIYFVICVIYSLQLSAQTNEDINRKIDSLNRGIKIIVADKRVSDSCKRKLNAFAKSFTKPESGDWVYQLKNTTIKNSEKFIALYNSKAAKACLDTRTKALVKTAQSLISGLNKYSLAKSTSKDSIARLNDSAEKAAASQRVDSPKVIAVAPKKDSADLVEVVPDSDSKADTSVVSDLESKVSWLIGTAAVLALIIIALAFTTFGFSKKLKSQAKKMEVQESVTGEAPSDGKNADQPKLPEDATEATGEMAVLNDVPEPVAEVIPPVNPAYFVCEVMMTAGPRKKFMGEDNADKDLGEDVCGFVSISEQVLIWLLDGTSDLHCLRNPVNKREYFSSRLLALGIAEHLKTSFLATMGQTPISDMVQGAITMVKQEWLEIIEQLPEVEKQVLKLNIENKNYPECAATILIAGLKINGDLTAYRSGDSKMYFFRDVDDNNMELHESSLVDKNDESNDRIFFRLKLNEEAKFDIIYNEPLFEVVTENSISSIICFSDGIGKDTEQLLIEEYKKDPVKARREIVYHTQETGDDKSICFIGIKSIAQSIES